MLIRRHSRFVPATVFLAALALAAGCAQGTKPVSQSQQHADSGNGGGSHYHYDTGYDTQPADSGLPQDVGVDTRPTCSPSACTIGDRVCVGQGQIANCVDDGNGCGTPASPTSCGSNKICSAGQCVQDTGACVDSDGDGYGANCASGPDCNDGDSSIHPNAFELCDGVDNDCDGQIDEDFAQKGHSCTSGQGTCATTGTYVCKADGSDLKCNAPAPQAGGTELCGDGIDNDCDGQIDEGFASVGQSCTVGSGSCAATGTIKCDSSKTGTYCDAPGGGGTGSMEICDGIDNDCDGQVDEAMCNSCTDDTYEPNQSSLNGTDLTTAKTINNLVICGDYTSGYDVDWFDLGYHAPTDSVKLELTQETGTNHVGDNYPDLDIEFFCGTTLCGAIRGSSATTSGTLTGSCGCAANDHWTVHVYPHSVSSPAVGTPYSIRRY